MTIIEESQALPDGAVDLGDILAEIFRGHGIECSRVQDAWLAPNDELPAIRALWLPGDQVGHLDVQVLLPDGSIIDEAFAGLGDGEQGLADALQNFVSSSLHVLLAGLWGIIEEGQLDIEEWQIGDRSYSLYLGNYAIRSFQTQEIDPPDQLFQIAEQMIRSEQPPSEISWYRFYMANLRSGHSYEVLRNNEAWHAMNAQMPNVDWPERDHFYSFRLFMLLRAH
jgi:hypothetical protein